MAISTATTASSLPKAPTGITGLDEVTAGGLPRGRTTLVVGGPGCGKTLLGMEFLVRGAAELDEHGVFVAFEETASELAENVRSLGHDLESLVAQGKLLVDHVRVERSEIEETGDYDLQGLFVRLGYAIDSVGAKRVVIDTLEVLFGGLQNETIVRAELRRLFRWLKERGVTAIVTAERGAGGGITRHGLEEYVSDCVIVLDHRIEKEISTRRLRVVKYRGSRHGANEYPFLIDDGGLSVYPITSLRLDHPAPTETISSGIPDLDEALGARGFLRGSSILVSGTAGTGKTSIAASFIDAACARGERCVYFAMEESPDQLTRNMSSIGLNLCRWREAGLLELKCSRPTLHGLEMHLAHIQQAIERFAPRNVAIDPITNLDIVGSAREVTTVIMRILDYLKAREITAVFTALTSDKGDPEHSEVGVSSWMDAWILLRTDECEGVRRRGLYVIKSRGMAHSEQIHALRFTPDGIRLGRQRAS